MDWESPFIAGSALCGIIFLIAGGMMYKFPPKEINSLYGYRTRQSMSSQEKWDFAQLYSSKLMILLSSVMTALSIALSFFYLNPVMALVLSFVLIFAVVILLFYFTERKLRKL